MARTVTFSDSHIVDFVQQNFIPVWESVSEVTTVVYDLGEGREVRATMNGEIALYFCRPDGKVFDIVPALQSPKTTLEAMKRAIAFYQKTGATDEAIKAYHQQELEKMLINTKSKALKEESEAWKKLAKERLARPGELKVPKSNDPKALLTFRLRDSKGKKIDPDQLLRDMSRKSVVVPMELPPILIIEPRGIDTFAAELHAALAIEPPKTAEQWKTYVFVDILGQSLEGGETVRFDINSDEGSLAITQ